MGKRRNLLRVFRSASEPPGTRRQQTVGRLADIHLCCNQTWLSDRSGFCLEAAQGALGLMIGDGGPLLKKMFGFFLILAMHKGVFFFFCVCKRLSARQKYGAAHVLPQNVKATRGAQIIFQANLSQFDGRSIKPRVSLFTSINF